MTAWSVRLRTGEGRTSDDHPAGRDAARRGAQEFVIEESLGYLVNRLARSMAGQLAEELRPEGVAIGQWAILLILWARDGMSQAELSRVVAIEPPTVVRTIDRMVRDGLVNREPDPRDRRVTRIHLTARGRALRDALVPKAAAVNAATLSRLTTGEADTLQRLLRKLLEPPEGQSRGRPVRTRADASRNSP